MTEIDCYCSFVKSIYWYLTQATLSIPLHSNLVLCFHFSSKLKNKFKSLKILPLKIRTCLIKLLQPLYHEPAFKEKLIISAGCILILLFLLCWLIGYIHFKESLSHRDAKAHVVALYFQLLDSNSISDPSISSQPILLKTV